MADGVGRVEAALKSKLGQVQQQADALQAALRSISTESGKLARADQRLASMQAHLQDKLAVNRSRQQVRAQADGSHRLQPHATQRGQCAPLESWLASKLRTTSD